MHTPLFSVLVPAYNIESLIRQTLESALAQTIQDLEIVVVDDGSSDKTTEVVHSFTDPRIRLIHQANAGVSAARNRAIAEARGKYVAFWMEMMCGFHFIWKQPFVSLKLIRTSIGTRLPLNIGNISPRRICNEQ